MITLEPPSGRQRHGVLRYQLVLFHSETKGECLLSQAIAC